MIAIIKQWLGLDEGAPMDDMSAFLAGYSIPQISAGAGQDIIRRQREIEVTIRQHILELEQYILALEQDIAALQQELGR